MPTQLLVLIHLQPGIVEWAPLALIDRVKELVADYNRQGFPIFVLELDSYPPTCAWLDSLLRDYEKFHCLRGESTDGSSLIAHAMCQGPLAASNTSLETVSGMARLDCLKADGIKIAVGGLFSYACVFDTVSGLSRCLHGAELTVIRSACDDYLGGDWSAFQSLPGVSLES